MAFARKNCAWVCIIPLNFVLFHACRFAYFILKKGEILDSPYAQYIKS